MSPSKSALGDGLSADELLARIDERIEILKPLVEELNRLEAARVVLAPDAAASKPRRAAAPRSPAGRRRAPRGANRAAILALARTSPGITVAQLAETTGIAKPTVHSTVYALTRAGELARDGDGVKVAGEPMTTSAPARLAASARRGTPKRSPKRGPTGRRRRARVSAARAGATRRSAAMSPDPGANEATDERRSAGGDGGAAA